LTVWPTRSEPPAFSGLRSRLLREGVIPIATKTKKGRKKEYKEEPGWGSAFERPENEDPQPKFTGTGLLDRETAKAILEAGGEFQLAVWVRRAKTGTRYLRIHIEPPYDGGVDEDDDLDDLAPKPDEDDDLPF
jgi:hypothetical protein